MLISTVTYSVKIYTPDTNFENVLRLKVQIIGDDYMGTERRTLANPETEVQGYVIYQTPETVLSHFQTPRRDLKIGDAAEYF